MNRYSLAVVTVFVVIAPSLFAAVWVDDLSGRYAVQEKTQNCLYRDSTTLPGILGDGLVDIQETETGANVSWPVKTPYAQAGWGDESALDPMAVGNYFDSGYDGVGDTEEAHFTANGIIYKKRMTDSGQPGYLQETDVELEADSSHNVLLTIVQKDNAQPTITSTCHLNRVN